MDTLRIRTLRLQRELTVAQLASSAGVSAGLISQVERSLADPSLETLRRIAAVLDVPLFELFAVPDERQRVSVIRHGKHVEISSRANSVQYSRLTDVGGQLEVLRGELPPGGSASDAARSHPAEECVVVITGKLTVEVDGAIYELVAGDSCHFDSRLPHRLTNDSAADTVFIVSVTPPSY